MSHGAPINAIEPSAYGFRSIKPKTRHERFSLKDKVTLEKDRINQRVGFEARMHQQNAPATTDLLTSCTEGAAGYISNSDRFHTDATGEEYERRQMLIERKHAVASVKRAQSMKRDENRWNEAEAKARHDDEYWNKMREDGSKARKNTSNVAYDIMTIKYNQNVDGENQKYLDDMVRYRAAIRSNSLVVKGDTRAAYNIINGEDRPSLQDPIRAVKPSSYKR